MIVDEATTPGTTYVGFADVGRGESEPKWQIFIVDESTPGITRQKYVVDVTTTKPSEELKFIWANRASYTYSLS